MPSKQIPREPDVAIDAGEKTGGHPGFSQTGLSPVKTVTDTWVTGQSKADATTLSSLPKAVANAIDGKDHSQDEVLPDHGGRVFDEIAAAANRKGSQ